MSAFRLSNFVPSIALYLGLIPCERLEIVLRISSPINRNRVPNHYPPSLFHFTVSSDCFCCTWTGISADIPSLVSCSNRRSSYPHEVVSRTEAIIGTVALPSLAVSLSGGEVALRLLLIAGRDASSRKTRRPHVIPVLAV